MAVQLKYLVALANPAAHKALNTMLTYMGNGMGAAAARKAAGVANHTHGELWVFMAQWHAAGAPTPGVGAWAPTPANVAYLRQQPLGTQAGWGWGRIMVALGQPHQPLTLATVHALYAAHTNTHAAGQRVGKGGRYLGGNAKLYQQTLKATGTKVPLGQMGNANQLAMQQMVARYTIGQMRQQLQALGVSYSPKATKTQLAKLLLANQ